MTFLPQTVVRSYNRTNYVAGSIKGLLESTQTWNIKVTEAAQPKTAEPPFL